MKPIFKDLFPIPEDDRIDEIGRKASSGLAVGFVVEIVEIIAGAPGPRHAKGKRYCQKLRERFPGLEIEGPTRLKGGKGLLEAYRVRMKARPANN